jgi:hypothetical protein
LPQIAKGVNTDLSKGFTVQQVAQKHGWPESLVWSQALVNAGDVDRFKALQWGIRTWDVWNFMECDPPYFDKKADAYAEKKDPRGHQPVCDGFELKWWGVWGMTAGPHICCTPGCCP